MGALMNRRVDERLRARLALQRTRMTLEEAAVGLTATLSV